MVYPSSRGPPTGGDLSTDRRVEQKGPRQRVRTLKRRVGLVPQRGGPEGRKFETVLLGLLKFSGFARVKRRASGNECRHPHETRSRWPGHVRLSDAATDRELRK